MKNELNLFEVDAKQIESLFSKRNNLEDIDVSEGSCFWISSIDLNNKHEIDRYLSFAEKGDIENLRKYHSIDPDMLCSYLVKRKNIQNAYYLLVVQQYEGLTLPQIIAIHPVDNLNVKGKKARRVKVEYMPKNYFIEFLRSLVKIMRQ